MELRWDAVTVDALDAERLATFWAALLDVEVRGRWEQYIGLRPAGPGLLDPAVERAVSLGASLTGAVEQGGQQWRVLADPEGNPFCLVSD